jgi:hypothetical protein
MRGTDQRAEGGGMNTRNTRMLALVVLLAAAPQVACPQAVEDFDRSDLYLRGGKLAGGGWTCGFAILGNHRTRDDPHIEWDINVEEATQGSAQPHASVAVATYEVARRSRRLREAVTTLIFSIEQDPQAIRAQLHGPAAQDNAVQGELTAGEADRLFAGIDAGRFITIQLAYQTLPAEAVRVHFVPDVGGPAGNPMSALCDAAQASRLAKPNSPGGSSK